MSLDEIAWFENELNKRNSKIFFNRFNNIDFSNKKILDLGCGCGALALDCVINKGAKKVIGIDLNKKWIEFANNYIYKKYSEVQSLLEFHNIGIEDLNVRNFDIIISKEVFEHIIDLDSVLIEMKNKLSIGGLIITGFGPLYNSPVGHHWRFTYKFPFAHVLFPQKFLLKKLNIEKGTNYMNITDLGLNGLSLAQYKKYLFKTPGLEVMDFRTNVNERLINIIMNLFAKIPFAREFFTHNIYCVLKRVN